MPRTPPYKPAPLDEPDRPAVYICLCNALTDRQLRQAAVNADGQRPKDLYAACGCRAQCGNCVKAVLALLRDATAPADAKLQGAD